MAARLVASARSERAREEYERAQAQRADAERRLAERRKVLAKAVREDEARVRHAEMQRVLHAERQVGMRLLDDAADNIGLRSWMETAFPSDTCAAIWEVFGLGADERAKRRDPRPNKRNLSGLPVAAPCVGQDGDF